MVYALIGYPEVDLYPPNPVTLAKPFHPGGAKDDPTDAALALDLMERHRNLLTVWRPDSEPIGSLPAAR